MIPKSFENLVNLIYLRPLKLSIKYKKLKNEES